MSAEATKIPADFSSEKSIAPEATSEPWPSPRRAWYAVFVFALALMINFLDRGIVTLLVGPIKRDLRMSDMQMGLLMGFAFTCFYAILGLPIARLVDYKTRRAILGVGVAIWSFMTALCGLAQNFWQLFLCRVGVGTGETCSGPSTYSMLADLFPREKLPRAIAVLNFGFYAGNGLALIIGGSIATAFSNMPPVTLPLIDMTLRGWQLTFIAVGLPGLIVAALLWTVREPKRRGRFNANTSDSTKPIPIREVIAFFNKNRSTYGPIFIGMGIQIVMTIGGASWAPEFYRRTWGWTPKQFGWIQGVLALTVMPAGAMVGSLLAERFAKAGRDDANMRVVLVGKLAALPFGILFPFMPNAFLAVTVSTVSLFCLSWTAAPLNAALQVITPNQMRGQITYLFMFIFNVIGVGLGPLMVAFFTDYVFKDESQLGLSLVAMGLLLGPLGTIVVWLGLKPYGRSVKESREWA
jgi:MFS family permease